MCFYTDPKFKPCPNRIGSAIEFINNDSTLYEAAQRGLMNFCRRWFRDGQNGDSDWEELCADYAADERCSEQTCAVCGVTQMDTHHYRTSQHKDLPVCDGCCCELTT